MNTFSKFFLLILGIFIGIAGVLQLQNIAFDLLSAPDNGFFYLGLFYLAIVIFIWGSSVHFATNYLKKLIKKENSVIAEQQTSNKQKPNN